MKRLSTKPYVGPRLAFLNSGQAYARGPRMLVPKGRFDQVKRAIGEAMAGFDVGDPADPKTALGRWCTETVRTGAVLYRKGIEEGAEVLVGGEGNPEGFEVGYFAKPTVFVQCEERYGSTKRRFSVPLLSVIAYDSETRRSIANDSKYAFHAPVIRD